MQIAKSEKPVGLALVDAAVDREFEKQLIDWIDGQPWVKTLKRRVQHYGWRYDYRARNVSPDDRLGPLPRELVSLLEIAPLRDAFTSAPDQIIINEYLPGQGISAHIDREPCFGPVIGSLSLGGGVDMIFRNGVTGTERTVRLEPRSLLILSGSSRYDWTHEIPARKSDEVGGVRIMRERRLSLTFRTMKQQ